MQAANLLKKLCLLISKNAVFLREIVGDFFTIINFWEYGNKEQASLPTHKKTPNKQTNPQNSNTHKFYNIMNTLKWLISPQCTGYWLKRHRNVHRITPNQCPLWQLLRRGAGAAGRHNIILARSSSTAARDRLPALTLGTAKHPSTLLLIQTEFQIHNVNLFPILKGFLWLKEIYNQDDNPQDSMNLWRQNYGVRARKHLLELPQILIFFLKHFAQQ